MEVSGQKICDIAHARIKAARAAAETARYDTTSMDRLKLDLDIALQLLALIGPEDDMVQISGVATPYNFQPPLTHPED